MQRRALDSPPEPQCSQSTGRFQTEETTIIKKLLGKSSQAEQQLGSYISIPLDHSLILPVIVLKCEH